MTLFTLAELSTLSGVKASRLRLWRSRYDFPKAIDIKESRKFSEEELLKLVNASTLVTQGWRISKVLQLSPDQLMQKALMLSDISLAKFRYGAIINGLLRSVMEYDQINFVNLYDSVSSRLELAVLLEEIDMPLIQRMWTLWSSGKVDLTQYYYLRQLLVSSYSSILRLKKGSNTSLKETIAVYSTEVENDLLAHFCAAWLHRASHNVVLVAQAQPWLSPSQLISKPDIDKVLCLQSASDPYKLSQVYSFNTGRDLSELVQLLNEL